MFSRRDAWNKIVSCATTPIFDRSDCTAASRVSKGACVFSHTGGQSDVCLLATGSQVALFLAAHEELVAEDVEAR